MENNNWTNVSKKNHRKKNLNSNSKHNFRPITNNSPPQNNQHTTTPIESNETKLKHINSSIFQCTPLEYRHAFVTLCDKINRDVTISDTYCDPDFDDWFLQTETMNLIIDHKLQSEYQIDPFFSIAKNNQIIVEHASIHTINNPKNESLIDSKTLDTLRLPYPIGLIREYETSPDKLKRDIICVMRTVGDFHNTINGLVNKNGNAFSSQLINDESKLQNMLHTIKTTTSDHERNVKMKEYCGLFSIWTFIKLSNNYKDGDVIPDPKIKDKNGCTRNDININTKKLNGQTCPQVISDNFDKGLFENLTCSLVGGYFPAEIISLQLSKTIVYKGRNYIEGYRIRIMLNTMEPPVVASIKEWIDKVYIDTISFGSEYFFGEKYEGDNCKYRDCIVNISDNTRIKTENNIQRPRPNPNTRYANKGAFK